MRIISICPSNTELVVYLGLSEHLIALDDFSDWPNDLNHLPRVGPDLSINMDLVEAYQPDLVLASLSVPGMEKNITELEKRNIPHVVFNPQSLQDIAEDLLTLGKLTNHEERSKKVVEEFLSFIHTYKKISLSIKNKKTVYFEWWPNPIFTPGEVNWLTEISQLAGAKNIFADVKVASVQTTWEDVFRRNPEHICLSWVGVKQSRMKNPAHVLKRTGSQELQAVKNNNIHLLEEALYCRPSPRLLVGLEKLAHLLHPGIYPTMKHEKS
ncbi:cobalamin-binding protein [Bacillus weihaiensis]|uniref:cobalamin-binding protein n=1 Tax=Bacillus weihaiensis TaxID=1547283 RepID=UPI002353E532|nr:cobalamin-binding protein [Bacillus weihaiensis]